MVLQPVPAIIFSSKDVRWAFPPVLPLEWTKTKIDDEMRANGVKFDSTKFGFNFLRYIGFEMEVSPKVARGKFIVEEKASQSNGELMKGVVDYIAESIASVAGILSFEGQPIAGVELTLNHLRPAYVGQEVTAIAMPLRQTRFFEVWEVKFETEDRKQSSTEPNADPLEPILLSVASFTLLNQTVAPLKWSDVHSKL